MLSFTLALFFLASSVVKAQGPPPFQLQISNPFSVAAGIQLCVSAPSNSDGAPATIHNCNTEPTANRSLFFSLFDRQSTPPQNIVAFDNKCLDVENGVNANGTPLQWWTCGNKNPNQLWVYVNNFTMQWSGTNKCLDLPNGDIADGTRLQIWECAQGNINQFWQGEALTNAVTGPSHIVGGPISPDVGPFCIVAEGSANGSPVGLANCANATTTFPNGNATFVLANGPLSGPIRTFGGTKCIDVKDGNTTNGNKLQIWDCVDGNTNQLFRENSPNHITWVGKNKCLDLTGGSSADGTPIQIWDCIDGNTNQNWFLSLVD